LLSKLDADGGLVEREGLAVGTLKLSLRVKFLRFRQISASSYICPLCRRHVHREGVPLDIK